MRVQNTVPRSVIIMLPERDIHPLILKSINVDELHIIKQPEYKEYFMNVRLVNHPHPVRLAGFNVVPVQNRRKFTPPTVGTCDTFGKRKV